MIRLPTFPSVTLNYNAGGNTFHASTSYVPPDVPPEVPTDVPPLATHIPPVPEENHVDTEEFLSSSSFSTTESSSDTPPHFFTDEDFTPAPKQPEHDPIPSPIRSTPPAPTAAPSPPPVPTQLTPATE
ncbi:leucine-rich repeat extensin-like protein 3 [Hibiscus syriacus]|uniref:leucine-rich repeat extensin-like protein 3 n=1 Tax=Hibiscus syriacus TaxID=106335 RepID=UPI00192432A0|nr:leucine-rich repeat extensin-like protein 3 [Hibiscus syriacus]